MSPALFSTIFDCFFFKLRYDFTNFYLLYNPSEDFLPFSNSKYTTITIDIDMTRRLALIIGVFFTVLVQFSCCEKNPSSTSNVNYADLLKVNNVKCDARHYLPEAIANSMIQVCKENFNGDKPWSENYRNFWKRKIKIFPMEELKEYTVSRPYFMIPPLKSSHRFHPHIQRKISKAQ